ncbi:V-type proton ATPase subunit E3 [Gracilariopsis chorda]|uniref:V-type proton ATPase subunit E3 n=1 Tax=Gracilariopsis chorda TaxID=448386 RepID=A0A2V3IT66_9FLOR|nr:V-type proton ATPase subunit E3 [Gracilariopsis chorda]|eukprot:PXF45292.1 V-type proton ATPase subunit E3 [Gracilariopsis chorda]
MNDAQVKQQIQQMVSFIRQEAKDKSNEIRVKAEEDFNIRKLSTVEAAREKIRAEYEKKVKQIDINRKIAKSTDQNAARLQQLKARDAILQETYDDAAKKLSQLPESDPEAYHALLKALIQQGLNVLNDKDVVVRCRRVDAEIVKSSLPSLTEEYVASTKDAATIVLDSDTYLSDNCTGGVVLLSQGGTIVVENTFESRLEIAYQQNLPQIRVMMFTSQ